MWNSSQSQKDAVAGTKPRPQSAQTSVAPGTPLPAPWHFSRRAGTDGTSSEAHHGHGVSHDAKRRRLLGSSEDPERLLLKRVQSEQVPQVPQAPQQERAAIRAALKTQLDAKLDATCGPALEAVRRAALRASQCAGQDLEQLSLQLQGLAEVRGFVDEQIMSDLSGRARACIDLARRAAEARPRPCQSQSTTAFSDACALSVSGGSGPALKLALAPFRSSSRSVRR